jgi:hypothetical protein
MAGQDRKTSELTAPASIADTDMLSGYRPGLPNEDIQAAVGLVRAPATATQANFRSLAATINTAGKYAGKPGWDTTNSKPVWSVGATAAAVWVDGAGTTAHTPV